MSNAITEPNLYAVNTEADLNRTRQALRISLNCLLGKIHVVLITCLNTEYLKPNKQPITHWFFVIQELLKPLCYSLTFNEHETLPFSNKEAFEPEKLKATDWQQKRELRLTCPFHTWSQWNSPQTNTGNQWGNPWALACFTVGEIQKFKPTMLNCRLRKANSQREQRRVGQRKLPPFT